MVILIFLAFIVMCITIDAVVQNSKKKKYKSLTTMVKSSQAFNEMSLSIPRGLYFDKTHTWAFMEKNGVVKIGIDDFLVHVTGALSRLKMKKTGEKIYKGEPVLTIIQNGKQLTISSPISGTVMAQNIHLLDDPSPIKFSPFNEGWIYSIEPSNWQKDMQFLVMADKYKEWLKNEFSRLKDFFATAMTTSDKGLIPVMLQDGGELNDNILADLGPEVWEDFQAKFIDASKYDFGKSDSTFTIINI